VDGRRDGDLAYPHRDSYPQITTSSLSRFTSNTLCRPRRLQVRIRHHSSPAIVTSPWRSSSGRHRAPCARVTRQSRPLPARPRPGRSPWRALRLLALNRGGTAPQGDLDIESLRGSISRVVGLRQAARQRPRSLDCASLTASMHGIGELLPVPDRFRAGSMSSRRRARSPFRNTGSRPSGRGTYARSPRRIRWARSRLRSDEI
jgi:hypothetical protein